MIYIYIYIYILHVISNQAQTLHKKHIISNVNEISASSTLRKCLSQAHYWLRITKLQRPKLSASFLLSFILLPLFLYYIK